MFSAAHHCHPLQEQGRIAVAITVDETPEVSSVDNSGYLLMARLSTIAGEELGQKVPLPDH
jgi:hypothetical protein